MRTIAWSPRVGEVWTHPDRPDVEIIAEHTQARLVKILAEGRESEWISTANLEGAYTQACCNECGMPLTVMRKMLIDARTVESVPSGKSVDQADAPDVPQGRPLPVSEPSRPPKAKPGSYCTKACCWPPHAPAGC